MGVGSTARGVLTCMRIGVSTPAPPAGREEGGGAGTRCSAHSRARLILVPTPPHHLRLHRHTPPTGGQARASAAGPTDWGPTRCADIGDGDSGYRTPRAGPQRGTVLRVARGDSSRGQRAATAASASCRHSGKTPPIEPAPRSAARRGFRQTPILLRLRAVGQGAPGFGRVGPTDGGARGGLCRATPLGYSATAERPAHTRQREPPQRQACVCRRSVDRVEARHPSAARTQRARPLETWCSCRL